MGEITQEVKYDVLEKLADGNFKIKYPQTIPEQIKDGLVWKHLDTIAADVPYNYIQIDLDKPYNEVYITVDNFKIVVTAETGSFRVGKVNGLNSGCKWILSKYNPQETEYLTFTTGFYGQSGFASNIPCNYSIHLRKNLFEMQGYQGKATLYPFFLTGVFSNTIESITSFQLGTASSQAQAGTIINVWGR